MSCTTFRCELDVDANRKKTSSADLVDPVQSVLSRTGSRPGLLKDPDRSFVRGAGTQATATSEKLVPNTNKILEKS